MISDREKNKKVIEKLERESSQGLDFHGAVTPEFESYNVKENYQMILKQNKKETIIQ